MDRAIRDRIGVTLPAFVYGTRIGDITLIKYANGPAEWYAELDADHWSFEKSQDAAWRFLVDAYAERHQEQQGEAES
jgi:hypothetical protein